MSAAAIVNRVMDRLRTSRPKFASITDKLVEFEHAGNRYAVAYSGDEKKLLCKRAVIDRAQKKRIWVQDAYSSHIQGVLNGMKRDDAGNLVAV
jgi:hypothetical protein